MKKLSFLFVLAALLMACQTSTPGDNNTEAETPVADPNNEQGMLEKEPEPVKPSADLNVFWPEFQKAAAKKDAEMVSSMAKFPMGGDLAYIAGNQDGELTKDEFVILYKESDLTVIEEIIVNTSVEDIETFKWEGKQTFDIIYTHIGQEFESSEIWRFCQDPESGEWKLCTILIAG